MRSARLFLWPLLLSAAVHAGTLALTGAWKAPSGGSGADAIEISYVQVDRQNLQMVKAVEPIHTSLPTPRKKVRGIPIPRQESASQTPTPAEPVSEFQKKIEEGLKKQARRLDQLSAEEREAPEKARPRSGAEIMADPKKGKIFLGYFGDIKRKIQKTLHDRFAYKYSSKGQVQLVFVLNSLGGLEKVTTADDAKDLDPALKELAIQCLKDAAPFGEFPVNLGTQKIAFNLTIFFDGR